MQRIYLVTTGGTIEKVYAEESGTVLNSVSKIDQYLKKLRLPECEVWVVATMNKDGLEMTAEDRASLLLNLAALIPHGDPIVITHGTDMMVETGLQIKKRFPA